MESPAKNIASENADDPDDEDCSSPLLSKKSTPKTNELELLDNQPSSQIVYAVEGELVEDNEGRALGSALVSDQIQLNNNSSHETEESGEKNIDTPTSTNTFHFAEASKDDSGNNNDPNNTEYDLSPKEQKGKGKLRQRFGLKKKKKKQQYLGFKKFESEYNNAVQRTDEDLDEERSWGALLPPYDSGRGSDTDINENLNSKADGNRRVRFDMSSQEPHADSGDEDQDLIRISNARIANYKNAIKIVGLVGIAILLTALAWVTGATGLFGLFWDKELDMNITNSNDNVVATTQPPYDVRNEVQLPTLKPTQQPYPTLKPTIKSDTNTVGDNNNTVAVEEVPNLFSTLHPTVSPAQDCNIIKIEIVTGFLSSADELTWSLIRYDNSEVIMQGGPLLSDETYLIGGDGEEDCVASGRYVFNITNTGGHGFGSLLAEKRGGYYLIYSNDTMVGGSDSFFLNEEFSFSVPYYWDEPDGDEILHCSNDFFMVFFTDSHPEQNTFELYHKETDQVIVRGGPYQEGPSALYYSRACLPDGVFNLTLFDSAGDGVKYPGHFQVYVEEKFLDLKYEIGDSTSTSFELANHPMPTSKPTVLGCENLLVLIASDLDDAHKFYGHTLTWDLIDTATEEVLIQEGPLSNNANLTYNECVPPGRYSFNITNTRGDGLGPKGNYLLFSDKLMIGGSTKFGVNEEMVFSLPYDVDELSGSEFNWCAGDFFIKVSAAANPQLLSWKVTNETGGVFAAGGPYRKPFDTYSQWVCLPNGSYTLYIHSLDIFGSKENKVTVFVESKLLVSLTDDDFGQSYSVSFDLA